MNATKAAATAGNANRDGDRDGRALPLGRATCDSAPPRPAVDPKTRRCWLSFGVVLGFVALLAILRQVADWEWPLPQCWLRKFTGIPCPTCGCTRSLRACAQLDPAQAFLLNPLFFLLCVGLFLWPVVAAFERISGREWFSRAWTQLPTRRFWQIAVVLIMLNWLYLWLELPK